MDIPVGLAKTLSDIPKILKKTANPSESRVNAILEKARRKKGISLEEAGFLVNSLKGSAIRKIYKVASGIKQEIYGERLVFFAPLYISDYCVNDCDYCNFHGRNKKISRKRLSLDEIGEQTKFLINQGHKRILLELGEDARQNDINYLVKAIRKIYSVKTPKGNIRRVNVNIAATTVKDYRALKSANIGTYQLFQETYHKPTYEKIHRGPKADYNRQITAHMRAFEGGLDDVGLGVLFGLYDWKYETLALIAHTQYLDKTFGVGPHTISVPRFCPAESVNYTPEYPVSDDDFLKLIAVLRIAVPYTGMIISTRESPEIRKKVFHIGISQASAGSVTTTGGYGGIKTQPQFSIHDGRSLYEVINDVIKQDMIPSFCTACYRIGRTGKRFMDMAKPGDIHRFCRPNAIMTFAEYLADFTDGKIKQRGQKLIQKYLNQIEDRKIRLETEKRLQKIKEGTRDIYF
jgi:2-iminoacetate synthase